MQNSSCTTSAKAAQSTTQKPSVWPKSCAMLESRKRVCRNQERVLLVLSLLSHFSFNSETHPRQATLLDSWSKVRNLRMLRRKLRLLLIRTVSETLDFKALARTCRNSNGMHSSQSNQSETARLQSKRTQSTELHSRVCSFRVHADIEAQSEQKRQAMVESEARIDFLQRKAASYEQETERIDRQLLSLGYNGDLTHAALVSKSKELQALQESIQPLEAALNRYRALPPDLTLAQIKLEEAKRTLAALDQELASAVDLTAT
eukprot:m.451247 g.451247  ORF g.451247 m.451247 type:complete len:261 (-) comp56915_c0_seq1:163-945(-)